MKFNPEKLPEILREIAATEILPLRNNLSVEQIRQKTSATDLVTDADEAVERELTGILTDLWPGSQVIGEESVAENPARLDALRDKGVFWIVDPIDGTRNFIRGDDRFASMVALVVDGAARYGWIYFPVTDRCAIAGAGEGAFLDGDRLSGRPAPPLGALQVEYSPSYINKSLRAQIQPTIESLGEIRRSHCAAYNYFSLANGDLDLAIQGKMRPWDHAPGALLVSEAGGRAAFVDDGESYAPVAWVDRLMLVAADREQWPRWREILAA